MTHIFFDDSHHRRGEFSLGAFVVFDDDPSTGIRRALEHAGFIPGLDEYKSRHPHSSDPRWSEARRLLFRLAQGAKIGLVITPYSDRTLGLHTLKGLAHLLRENEIAPPVAAFLDQGLFRSQRQFDQWRNQSGLPSNVAVTPECDSRAIPGIQVADLVAHSCATALLGQLGVADKALYDEEEGEYQLSFEMWALLRYSFFARPVTDPDLSEAAHAGLVDSHSGLYIALECTTDVSEAADARFGQTWLGCIH